MAKQTLKSSSKIEESITYRGIKEGHWSMENIMDRLMMYVSRYIVGHNVDGNAPVDDEYSISMKQRLTYERRVKIA
jgi:hypothetical protein